jgi:hypothetical protein
VEKLKKEWNETPSFSKVRSESWEFQNPVHNQLKKICYTADRCTTKKAV